MKKMLLLLVFFATKTLTAQEVSFTIDDLLNNGITTSAKSSSEKISAKTSIANKIIMERSGQFSRISQFHSEVNIANASYFEQALTDVHIATKKQQYIDFEALRLIDSEEMQAENVVNVAILNSSYETINYNAEDPTDPTNGFMYIEGVSLTPIEGRQQFTQHHTTVISPLKDFVKGAIVKFKFHPDLVFSNGKAIQTLLADLGDGVYRNIITNGVLQTNEINISITNSAELEQTYQITYIGGETQTTKSSLYAKSVNSTPMVTPAINTKKEWHISSEGFQGYEESKSYNGAIEYRVFYANTDQILRKPVFILDGFDPEDKRKIEYADYNKPQDTIGNPSIYEKMFYYEGNHKKNLVEVLRDKGYDVVICNFPTYRKDNSETNVIEGPFGTTYLLKDVIDGGADYVERNSLAFASLIKVINRELETNGSIEELVVLGPSMGAIISRYALAYMEKKEEETGDSSWNHNTRLWVSMDGPHLGANIPIGIQGLLYLLFDRGGAASAKDTYYNVLKSTTAKQFLINQHTDLPSADEIDFYTMNGRVTEQGYTTDGGADFYRRFYKALYNNGLQNSKGFPMNLRKIAIVNGAIDGTKLGSGSQETLYIRGYGQTCLPWPLHNSCSNTHVATLGAWNLSNKGSGNQIISKFYKWPNTYNVRTTNLSSRGNFDVLSGGFTGTYDEIAGGTEDNKEQFLNNFLGFDIIINIGQLFRGDLDHYTVSTNIHKHGFIPTASALAIKQPQRDWGADLRDQIFCDGNIPINNSTPFDNYFVPYENEEHIEITNENVTWLLQELEGSIGEQDFVTGERRVFTTDVLSGQTVNYSSTGNITIAEGNSMVVVESGATVNFTAKGKIIFQPGFHSEQGANLIATVTDFDCENTVIPLASLYEEPMFSQLTSQKSGVPNKEKAVLETLIEEDNRNNIYPNPTKGIFYIENYKSVENLKMYNNIGILVYQKNKFFNKNIDVSHLVDGTYFLLLQLRDGTQSKVQIAIQN